VKAHLDCVPCFLRQSLQAARFSGLDGEGQERTLRRVLEALQRIEWDSSPAETARRIHRIVREECGVEDPYREAKRRSNDVVLALLPMLRQMVLDSGDPVETALRLAIAGNIIDFAARPDHDLDTSLSDVLEMEPAIDDSAELLETLARARSVLYLTDNAGEIALDCLFLQTALESHPVERVLVAVKGGPFINDATLEDARYVGLDDLPGTAFVEMAVDDSGPGVAPGSEELAQLVRDHDLVLAKGQANYEAHSETGGIYFLLLVKCPVVAGDLGVPVGEMVIRGPGRRGKGTRGRWA
jgi:uncharacterized protein with ATP-grasp and redox domains